MMMSLKEAERLWERLLPNPDSHDDRTWKVGIVHVEPTCKGCPFVDLCHSEGFRGSVNDPRYNSRCYPSASKIVNMYLVLDHYGLDGGDGDDATLIFPFSDLFKPTKMQEHIAAQLRCAIPRFYRAQWDKYAEACLVLINNT